MNNEPHCHQRPTRRLSFADVWISASAALVLVFAIAALSTVAKNGQYFPEANPAHQVSISTKMNVAHAPIFISGDPLRAVAKIAPPPPPVRTSRLEQFETA